MIKPSVKTVTVKNLINFLLVLAALLLIVTGINFRALWKQAMENHVLAHAQLVESGLTAHVKAGLRDKRDHYLEEMKAFHEIDKLRDVETGSVLGAVDIEPDVTPYQRRSLFVLSGISLTFLIFLTLIAMNTSRTIQRHVQSPLDTFIETVRTSYVQHEPVRLDQFAT